MEWADSSPEMAQNDSDEVSNHGTLFCLIRFNIETSSLQVRVSYSSFTKRCKLPQTYCEDR
jgi:hypothetical protein